MLAINEHRTGERNSSPQNDRRMVDFRPPFLGFNSHSTRKPNLVCLDFFGDEIGAGKYSFSMAGNRVSMAVDNL
jgi:hypothetical protein